MEIEKNEGDGKGKAESSSKINIGSQLEVFFKHVNCAKILRPPFFNERIRWLLLNR